jgi:hypothetical protein
VHSFRIAAGTVREAAEIKKGRNEPLVEGDRVQEAEDRVDAAVM